MQDNNYSINSPGNFFNYFEGLTNETEKFQLIQNILLQPNSIDQRTKLVALDKLQHLACSKELRLQCNSLINSYIEINKNIIKSTKFEFLGSIAGDQIYWDGGHEHYVYARRFDHLSVAQTLRKSLNCRGDGFVDPFEDPYREIMMEHQSDPEKWKALGEAYSGTHTFLQGGGFFKTVAKLKEEDSLFSLDNIQYALFITGKLAENNLKITTRELLGQYNGYDIDYIITQYFVPVLDQTREGDLVLYSGTTKHAGIYRNSEPNWNSPPGGTVESKWGFKSSPYIFQHDVFFVPNRYGDRAEFYRIRTEEKVDDLPLSHDDSKSPTFTILEDGKFQFIENESHMSLRRFIDKNGGFNLTSKLPQIKKVEHIKFLGVCFDYAFGKILRTYTRPHKIPLLEGTGNIDKILHKYFDITTQPKPGDFVTYYKDNFSVHYGVVYADGIIESKWGNNPVYRHPPFYVPNEYGNTIIYYSMKPTFTPETLLESLEEDKRRGSI
ncbi:MAG: hypothetical protein K0S74_359 [Chlamydiales bacterium]|jgi:hypothetical protein|nr:hypothetical protein [Chlamydiales bacterium]